jgi:Ca2+-binding EF-hand superfamily protein
MLAHTLLSLLRALVAIRVARATHAHSLSDSAHVSRVRVGGCPELHELMGEPLLALDPRHTGAVSVDALTRFLARLPLGLDEGEIADIIDRLPAAAPGVDLGDVGAEQDADADAATAAAVVSDGDGDGDGADPAAEEDAERKASSPVPAAAAASAGLVSYLPLQRSYESLLRQTARARAVNSLRGELGSHLRALMLKAAAEEPQSGSGGAVSVGTVLRSLLSGTARVHVSAIQAYALVRGLAPGREEEAQGEAKGKADVLGDDEGLGLGWGSDADLFGGDVGEEACEAAAEAGCVCACAEAGVDARATVQVDQFSLLAGLALTRLHAGLLEGPRGGAEGAGDGRAGDQEEEEVVDGDGKIRLGALLTGARADMHLDPRISRILENSGFNSGLDAGALLDQHDADADGRLCFTEFDSCVTSTGICVSRAEIRELFLVADRDGDGWVDEAELLWVTEGLLGRLAVAQRHNDQIDASMRVAQ